MLNGSQIGIVWIIVGTPLSVPAHLFASSSIAFFNEIGQWMIHTGECGFLQSATSLMEHLSLIADLMLQEPFNV